MHVYQICRILMTMSDGIVSKKVKGYRKITILMTFDLFKWQPHQTWLSKSEICDINAFHNSLVLIWGIMLGCRPFIFVIIWTFSDSKSQKLFEKSHIPDFSAFRPVLLIKALCSDQWSNFQNIDTWEKSYEIILLFHSVTWFYHYYFCSYSKLKL